MLLVVVVVAVAAVESPVAVTLTAMTLFSMALVGEAAEGSVV